MTPIRIGTPPAIHPTASYAIMAHPRRAHLVDSLREQLPQATVVWDRKNNRWDTGRRSMLAFNPDAEWHVVVQDDALLCRAFPGQVEAALSERTKGPVAFYMGRTGRFPEGPVRRMVWRARRAGLRWIAAPGPRWGPGVAMLTSEIPAMIRWCDTETKTANYDVRMEEYFRSLDRPCYYTVPSLVEHRHGRAHPSLVEGRGSSLGRTAAWWEPDGSPAWLRAAEAV